MCVDSSVLKARGCSVHGGKGAGRLQHANGSTANLKKSSIQSILHALPRSLMEG